MKKKGCHFLLQWHISFKIWSYDPWLPRIWKKYPPPESEKSKVTIVHSISFTSWILELFSGTPDFPENFRRPKQSWFPYEIGTENAFFGPRAHIGPEAFIFGAVFWGSFFTLEQFYFFEKQCSGMFALSSLRNTHTFNVISIYCKNILTQRISCGELQDSRRSPKVFRRHGREEGL